MKFKKMLEVSVFKSLRFNLHYFGLQGLKLPVLVSRGTILMSLRGGVELSSFKTGNVRLGFSGVGTCDVGFERTIWQVSGNVHIGNNVAMGQGTRISVNDFGELSLGDNFCVTARTSIICHNKVDIGNDVLISWDNLIMDTDFHRIDSSLISEPIQIRDSVWIGCRCLVLKGSSIPEGSVLAAGSIVSKILPESHALYGGINKVLRDKVTWRA